MSKSHTQKQAGAYDPLAGEGAKARGNSMLPDASREGGNGKNGSAGAPKPEPMISWHSPSELCALEVPEGWNLAGNWHLQRGGFSILAGAPGVGKSRAALHLALQMARGAGEWMGLPIHGRFRVLILQNENGLARLHKDFAGVADVETLDAWVRVSGPPKLGFQLANPAFRAEAAAMMAEFAPHLVICDPLNALLRDSQERDVNECFGFMREILSASPENPACLLIHHLRKPKSDDRHKGRGLSNLLAGSYTIFSVARSVMILQSASDDTTERQTVFTTSKNNDGELGTRTAWEWHERAGYRRVDGFDFTAFDEGSTGTGAGGHNEKVTEAHLRELFEGGKVTLRRKDAVAKLMALAQCKDKAAYAALNLKGRFHDLLEERDGALGLIVAPWEEGGC